MMNKSITNVAENTKLLNVYQVAKELISYAGKRVRVTFVKKNGDTRVMDCVPRNQYNATLGIQSTQAGKKMVATKCKRDMVTVAEIVGSALRPRTINLRTVKEIVPLAR